MYSVGIAHGEVMHQQAEKFRTQGGRITNHKSTNSIVLNVLPGDAFLWHKNIQMQTYYSEFKK